MKPGPQTALNCAAVPDRAHARLVDVGARLPATAFLQQPHFVSGEVRGSKAVGLGDAPAQCVVLVTKDLALRLAVFARPHHRHLGQPVLVVVAVVLLRVAAYAFSDQPTEAAVLCPALADCSYGRYV